MLKCKNCERELQKDEKEYCPACASNKSYKIKRIVEAVGPMVITIGFIAFKLLRKK